MKKIIKILFIMMLAMTINSNHFVAVSAQETMKAYYAIDKQGYVSDVAYLIKQDGVDYSNYIEIEPPLNLIKPRWDGMQWVEGYTETSTTQNIPDTTGIMRTSLTVSSLYLDDSVSYDINLNDKMAGSSYKWSSSDLRVAKVNTKNGLVTAVSDGNATITCTVIYADGTVDNLISDVSVGVDDNLPVLTDTSLELSVGDKYTLKAENAPGESKYKFTSSDKGIARIGTTSGKITAVSPGDAYIICSIVTPDNQTIVLRCDISITE